MPKKQAQKPAAVEALLAKGEWLLARNALVEQTQRRASAHDLELLGLACWHLSDAAGTFEAREHAYQLYREANDDCSAARIALLLAWDCELFRGESAIAQGWLGRAARLLEGKPPCLEQARLLVREAMRALRAQEPDTALELAKKASALSKKLKSVDLEMQSIALQGLLQVTQGEAAAGMRLLDEAGAALIANEVKDHEAFGYIGCWVIAACTRVRDFGRATEWCERLGEFCNKWDDRMLFSVCRGQYCDILIWRGAWDEAERELSKLGAEGSGSAPGARTDAKARLGVLLQRRRRFGEAKALLEPLQSHPLAALALAELDLESGRAQDAADRLTRELRRLAPSSGLQRVPVLEALAWAQSLLKSGDRGAATAQELAALGKKVPAISASVLRTNGRVALANEEAEKARELLEDALASFSAAGAPYESALCQLELSKALGLTGDELGARRLKKEAHRKLDALGVSNEAPPAAKSPLSEREREVLKLIAAGEANKEIAVTLELSEHTVHRHVANILLKLNLPNRAAAAAWAVLHPSL
ncbi:MAG: LuxR C-terminal-related transcriptional regulator [Myxococcaceae bacterium]